MHTLKTTTQPEALLSRVTALVEKGHLGAARALLAAARRLAPPSPQHAELSARIAINEGQLDNAQRELDGAIADSPGHAGLRKLRAELRRVLDDHAGAAADAAEAVVLDPRDAVAKAQLGVFLLDLGRVDDAVACLREAVAAEPGNPAFSEGLAAALEASGDRDAALDTLTAAIGIRPDHIGLRNAAVLLCVRHRDFAAAAGLAEQARLAGVVDACLFGLMGHALSSLGQHDAAAEAYAEALKLGPEDTYVRHLVAAAGVVHGADRAPVEYLRAVFDGYADRFELHLISLGYRVPGLIRASLLQHPGVMAGESLGPTLDLGCGTGLLAVILSDLRIGPLVGLDVSPAMLAKAAAKNLYHELHESEILSFLENDHRNWKLIVAADVLCYFGVLSDLFRAVGTHLAPGGWFLCSTEQLHEDPSGSTDPDRDWQLGPRGRYAHSERYVLQEAAGAGFTVRLVSHETLRNEADGPVPGLLFVLEWPEC